MTKGSTTRVCWVNLVKNAERAPHTTPIRSPPKTTKKKLRNAMPYWPTGTSSMPLRVAKELYKTTVTPSLNKDSPKTRKYRFLLTPISSKMAKTATGSTADIKELKRVVFLFIKIQFISFLCQPYLKVRLSIIVNFSISMLSVTLQN